MNQTDILTKINELIMEEGGNPVTIEDKLSDTHLDSLGRVSVLIGISCEFDIVEVEDTGALTIKELVTQCSP